MKIPTVQRTQILGKRGADKVADPNTARRKGEAWARFGKMASSVAQKTANYFKQAEKAKKNTALYEADIAFTDWITGFKHVGLKGLDGDEYTKAYEEGFSKFSGEYLKANPEFHEDVDRRFRDKFVSNKDPLNSMAVKKHDSDLKQYTKQAVSRSVETVKRAPETFMQSIADTKNYLADKAEVEGLTPEEEMRMLAGASDSLATAAVDGYARAGRFDEAIAFVNNPAVGTILGTEEQTKMRDKLLNDQAQATNKYRGDMQWKRGEEKRAATKITLDKVSSLVQSIEKTKTPSAVNQMRENIAEGAKILGITNVERLIGKTKTQLQDFSDDTSFDIYNSLSEADSPADYDRIKKQVIRKQMGDYLTSKDASRLLRQIETASTATSTDPNSKFEDKAGLQMLAQHQGLSTIEKAFDLNGEEARNWSGMLSEFWTLKAAGQTGIDAANNVLQNRIKAGGGVPPVHDLTGKRLNTQEAIDAALQTTLKSEKSGAIDYRQASKSYKQIATAENRIKLQEATKEASIVPLRPSEKSKPQEHARSVMEDVDKITTGSSSNNRNKVRQQRSFGGITREFN